MPDWQTIAATLCIILAGHFLVRRLLKFAGGAGAKGCGSCKSNPTALKSKPLVPLDVPDRHEAAPK